MTHTADHTAVTKPLKAYIPLITEQFDLAEKAGMEHYRTAGTLLNEVRDIHFPHDSKGFHIWAEKNFRKKRTQIRAWMALGAPDMRKSFTSIREYERDKGYSRPVGPGTRIHREWTAPVDAIADRARAEQRRLQEDEFRTRVQERDAERQLGLRLISIGYKVLAQELHPDKGGSREAMTRLNRVRDRLKTNV